MKNEWVSDNWHVSIFNFVEEVKKTLKFSDHIIIHDCTLRDGEQHPGVVFRKNEKIEIARKLDEIGIHQIETGMPAVSEEDKEAIKAIAKEGLKAKVTAICRLMKKDIDAAIGCEVWGVLCSAPTGYLQLQYKLGWSQEDLLARVLEVAEYAKEHGLYVILSPYDTPRANIEFLKLLLSEVSMERCVDRVRLVDTVGSITPQGIKYLVVKMKEMVNLPIEVHCHDDFGVATANTLAALSAGADVVSSTINGIGERAGNAPTEEVALALRVLYGIDLGLRYEKFYELSKLVQKLSRVTLQPHKAIVGKNAFRHESGLIVDGVLKMPFAGEAFSPELVGQTRRIVLGKKSGKSSIEFKLKELGISATQQQVEMVLQNVKRESIRKKSSITDENFRRIVNETLT